MIPADALNSLKALALGPQPLITAVPPASPVTGFEPGQHYQGTVQAQLAPGIFRVQVGDRLLQLQLPGSFHTGDKISLQVVSLLPRLTFNMSASSNPLSSAEQLSATSRLLSSLAQKPYEKGSVPTINTAPIWTGEQDFPETSELADKLRTALSQSGLFYEAHQAQWLAGKRNTAQLMQEPQNQSPEKIKAAFKAERNDTPTVTSTQTDAAKLLTAPERISIPGVPDHMHPIIQQQLNALETRQIQWHGQIWHEQTMDWKIREDAPKAARGEQGRQWETQIQLTLPNLGEVTATLRLGNGNVSFSFNADKKSTRDKLGAATSTLVSAMSDRGITVTGAQVMQHDNL